MVKVVCSHTLGGTLGAISANFAPGEHWDVTFASPPSENANSSSGGNARADGTINFSFPCLGATAGLWRAQVSQGSRSTPVFEFTVDP